MSDYLRNPAAIRKVPAPKTSGAVTDPVQIIADIDHEVSESRRPISLRKALMMFGATESESANHLHSLLTQLVASEALVFGPDGYELGPNAVEYAGSQRGVA